MISEGLADHFCLEVTKIDTPSWSKALSDSGLILWKGKAEKEWFRTEYDLYSNPGKYARLMDKHAVKNPCPQCGGKVEKIQYLGVACYFCPGCQS
jgi:formamidopyrimidine-DNA glycosylase